MRNSRGKNNLDQNVNSYLITQANWRSDRGDVRLLMKRLKDNEQKVNKEKFVFVLTAISVLIISGIIISF